MLIEIMLLLTIFTGMLHLSAWLAETAAGDFRDFIKVTGLFFLLTFIILLLCIALS